jgi:DNA-binding CsgD family transcriptional regulator/tetratricopeptide (TPR) repeat protein
VLGPASAGNFIHSFGGSSHRGFRETNDDPDGKIVRRLVRREVERGDWDLSFELVERFFEPILLETLVESALVSMLDEARVPTLIRWIGLAHEHSLQSPVVDLAEGEIAFKQGDLRRAEAFALQAARSSAPDHPFRSKAFWLAGVSAHLLARSDSALSHYEFAQTAASTASDLRHAIWGRVTSTAALDRLDVADELLSELEACSGPSADELLRLATGHLMLASLRGDVRTTLDQVATVAPLVARSEDPLIHSSFLNVHSAILALGGRYDAALSTANAEVELASTYGLAFAMPDAQFQRALALFGLRSFRHSASALNISERAAACLGHEFLLMNIGILRARLRLMTDPSGALDVFERYQSALERPAMQGEYCAWWSLGLALVGRVGQAESLVARAESLSQRIEVTALTPWTRCVIASSSGRSVAAHANRALETSLATGNVDAFVTTYRAFPPVLTALAANRRNHRDLKEILVQAHDHGLAESAGLRLPRSPRAEGFAVLSNREREVLDLVSQGMTNKQIGKALFIEEVTVKAHMRSVCKKLGVRTRTEAAMRAAELSD